ncbi:Zn-dependent exopeptidase [Mycena floridula]|nr:Zn-dependent exopeptidase [Mycena floridula]
MIVPAFGLLLVTPFDSALFNYSCLSSSFYGNYNDGGIINSVLLPEQSCFDSWSSQTLAQSASISVATQEIQQLVWLEQEAVDIQLLTETRSFVNEFDSFLQRISHPQVELENQAILKQDLVYEILYRTRTAALLGVTSDTARTIDTLLPCFWKSTILPSLPVKFRDVDASSTGYVKHVLETLKPDPIVASIVDTISIPQMKNDIRYLSGEDSASPIISRHSFSEGALTAAHWLKDRVEETGATCELWPFLTGFAPNVICRYGSVVSSNSTVLISAHYDSRGSFGSTRAPGADDDGSGTISILAIARTIARKGVKFHSNVELVAFAGEEQGLRGSRAYSRHLREQDANLTMVIQADMLAYRKPGEPLQMGMPESIGTPEVTQLVVDLAAIYSPELTVGTSPACCSDHQSFIEQGFPATQVFERNGPIADPMYHNSGDLSSREGYDFEQVKAISKVQFAALLHVAGFEL